MKNKKNKFKLLSIKQTLHINFKKKVKNNLVYIKFKNQFITIMKTYLLMLIYNILDSVLDQEEYCLLILEMLIKVKK